MEFNFIIFHKMKLAEVWLLTNYRGFTNNESMFEKVCNHLYY